MTWVGLTDEEAKAIWKQMDYDISHGKYAGDDKPRNTIVEFYRAIETKLKEKVMATGNLAPLNCPPIQPVGIKHDQAKPRMSLMPEGVIDEMLQVLEYGSAKYSDDNWQIVPDAQTRYYDAAHRHINAWWNCEAKDQESGKSHLAHAMCCLAFLMWFDKHGGEE